MSKVPFIYREFWDVPRMIVCEVSGTKILLESEFDDSLDDYSLQYKVFLLPEGLEPASLKSWDELSSKAATYLGQIPVDVIEFDNSKRKELEFSPLAKLLRDK